jgi:translocation and assembly module TamB
MRRRPLRWLLILVLGSFPALLGALAGLLFTESGRLLVGRVVAGELSGLLRGQFQVARVSGGYLGSLELDNVVIRDTTGALLADVPRLSVRYKLPNLLAKRIILEDLLIDRGTIRIVKHKNGRLNFQEIFRLGEGKPGGGKPPLIELRNARFRATSLEVLLPWNPPDTVHTEQGRLAALASDRARPGRVILDTPDGLRRIVTLDALNAKLARLLISSPRGDPLTFEVDSLSTRISDPAITVVQLEADGWTRADTLKFTIQNAVLPNTRGNGEGVLTWPHGPVLYDFTMVSSKADLRDFRWITPKLPAMTGRARVVAKSRDEHLISYSMRGLELEGPGGKATGRVTLLNNTHRGLGVENMQLDLTGLDMDVIRPFLDTLPLHGRLTGSLAGGGYLDALAVDYDGDFADSAVKGGAENRLSLAGLVHLGGTNGAVFDTMVVREADLDFRTIELLSPSIPLKGRLRLQGSLAGPWKNVTYSGTATQQDGTRPPSSVEGIMRLDTRRDTLRFATDLSRLSVSFDGIRPSFPALTISGRMEGPLRLSGTPDSMRVEGELHGELGRVSADGGLRVTPTRWGGDSLRLEFAGLDLAKVRGTGPETDLTGYAFINGSMDSVTGPTGDFALALSPSRVADLPVDSAIAVLHARDSLLTADTLMLRLPGIAADGLGTLGWRTPKDGEIRVSFTADSLVALDSLLVDSLDLAQDTTAPAHPLEGTVEGTLSLAGALDAPVLRIDAAGKALGWKGIRAPSAAATVDWSGGPRPELGVVVTADTVTGDRWIMTAVNGEVQGYADSLLWSGAAAGTEGVSLAAAGEWWNREGARVVEVDSARLVLSSRTWRLQDPMSLAVQEDRIDLTPTLIEASDGSGSLRLEGAVPRKGQAELKVTALGLDLHDFYQLVQRDTAGVSGSVEMDFVMGGTAAAPTFRGTASLSDLALGDLASPYVRAVIDYSNRRLDANLLLWKTGQQVALIEARLPIDLALQRVAQRELPGEILVRAVADSTDLSVIEAFTRTVRQVHGLLLMDAQVTGSWDQPVLAGHADILRGQVAVPALGVGFNSIVGRFRLAGDSIAIDSLRLEGGKGSLAVTGGLRLERLTRPILNLRFKTSQFRAIADRRLLTLAATGNLQLTGPIWNANLTGRLVADEGTLRFADLLSKRIVDLENPGDSGLIDISAIREEKLGAAFQSRFLDSLTITDLRLVMGNSFWLRSSEANIQLDGDLLVSKVRDQYRFDGTLSAVRGTYTLKIGFVARDFTVERGTVRYFGTPDLNAELDIEARHVVIDVDTRQEIPVIAKITGTLLQPKISLESDQFPPLSETEVVSYLMFGRSSFAVNSGGSATQGQSTALAAGLSYMSSALSSEIQRTLISDLGVPIDYLDIRPGTLSSGPATTTGGGALQVAQVSAGWLVGRKWYLALLTDVCTSGTTFYPSAEYRLNRPLRFKLAVEPTTPCTLNTFDPSQSRKRYQVGVDVLWDLDY